MCATPFIIIRQPTGEIQVKQLNHGSMISLHLLRCFASYFYWRTEMVICIRSIWRQLSNNDCALAFKRFPNSLGSIFAVNCISSSWEPCKFAIHMTKQATKPPFGWMLSPNSQLFNLNWSQWTNVQNICIIIMDMESRSRNANTLQLAIRTPVSDGAAWPIQSSRWHAI